MAGERDATTGRRRTTRRGLLAVAGATALAGCTDLSEFGGGNDPTISAYDLREIDPGDDPEPVIPESVPVDIAPAQFDAARNRVTSLLAELPTPLGPEEIPNGHVRRHLLDAATAATNGLDDARDAPTALAALTSLRRARSEARYAAAGWAVADRDLSADPLEQEYEAVVSEAQSARNAHEYVGTDPVRAALVHSRIEELLDRAAESEEPRGDGSHLLSVAEWGETTESARAHLDDARHLDAQFADSLPANPGSVEATLTEAAETLLADIRSRTSALPPEPTADEWGIPERAIADLRRDAAYGITRLSDAAGPASAVVDANRQRTRFRALARLQERVAAGDVPDPESAEAVREIRGTASDALEAALAESSTPELTRTAITGAAWRVANADWAISQHEGEISPSQLDLDVADYVIATAVGRAAPAVTERTVEALEGV